MSATKPFEAELIAGQLLNAIMAQREEILAAFVAKYGVGPGRVVQCTQGNRWWVELRDEIDGTLVELIASARRAEAALADSGDYPATLAKLQSALADAGEKWSVTE